MSRIEMREIRKVYPTGVVAVDGVSLTVADGEVLVLLGPTGSGKSTVLRLIAGLESATAGQIFFDGTDVQDTPARDRGIALVFQDFALYPHLTVADNIGFPLMAQDERRRTARVAEVASLLGLEALLRRRPGQLSGGQRQRVALGRAIARMPRALLMDQPLASLDTATRDAVRAELAELVRTLGVPTVYVTHDHVEALMMADRVAVMRRGRIEQLGTPEEIYGDPACLFVAAFVGSPRMNLVQAAILAEPDVRVIVDLGSQAFDVPWSDPRAPALAAHHGARVTVGVRPDALTVVTDPDREPALRGVVRAVELRGHDALVRVETGCAPTPYDLSHLEFPDAGELASVAGGALPAVAPVRARLLRLVPPLSTTRPRRPEDEAGRYAFRPAYDAHAPTTRPTVDLAVRMDAGLAPRPGDTLDLTLDLDRAYLFDGTGERIRLPGRAARLSATQPV